LVGLILCRGHESLTALALENGTAFANKLQEIDTSYPYILKLADRWNFVLGENDRRRIK